MYVQLCILYEQELMVMGLIKFIREEIDVIKDRDPAIKTTSEVFLYASFHVIFRKFCWDGGCGKKVDARNNTPTKSIK